MKRLHFYFVIIFAAIAGLYSCKQAKAKHLEKDQSAVIDSTGIRLQIITNAVSMPVQISVPSDSANRLFITDNTGKIWIMKNDSLLPHPFLAFSRKPEKKDDTDPVGTINSIAFHPQFSINHKFYVCYNAATAIAANKTKLVVAEFTASKTDADSADLKTEHRVFELEGNRIFANGAGIAFGPDGYLYISIGDNDFGDSSYVYHAQDLNYLNGKLLRIDVNKTPYAIPPDNPFVGMSNKRPEIWAYGFRKIWRFTFDPKSQQIFGADVGEIKAEEIDIITKGANYGWPVMEGDSVFNNNVSIDKKTFTSCINEYPRKDGICVIGGNFYYGKEIPFLQNKYVYGDFNSKIFTLTKDEKGQWIRHEVKIKNMPADPFLICAFDEDRNNELYVMGFLNTKTGPKGAVYKIVKE